MEISTTWRELYVRTFVSLQRQHPGLAPTGLAHLAHDAADDAIAEVIPPQVFAVTMEQRTEADEIEGMRTALGLPAKRSSEDDD